MPITANGCDANAAIDMTAAPTTTITFAGIEYAPRCVRVRAGSNVVFSGTFASHPLVGGTVNGSVGTPDPSSPVPATSTGSDVMFIPTKPGTYPYYCSVHASSGMMGVIFAE
jgi:plastocyanin